MRNLAALLLAALLAVSLAACSGQQPSSAEDFQGEQRAVAEVLEDLEDAAADEEYARICSALLSEKLATAVGKRNRTNCPAEMDTVIEDSDSVAVDVKRVTITGNSAEARVEQSDDNEDEVVTVRLVKQGVSWRLDDLSPVPVDSAAR